MHWLVQPLPTQVPPLQVLPTLAQFSLVRQSVHPLVPLTQVWTQSKEQVLSFAVHWLVQPVPTQVPPLQVLPSAEQSSVTFQSVHPLDPLTQVWICRAFDEHCLRFSAHWLVQLPLAQAPPLQIFPESEHFSVVCQSAQALPSFWQVCTL